ncbi:MAG: hypothetical protein ACOC0M_02860 [Halomonas sp.]
MIHLKQIKALGRMTVGATAVMLSSAALPEGTLEELLMPENQ